MSPFIFFLLCGDSFHCRGHQLLIFQHPINLKLVFFSVKNVFFFLCLSLAFNFISLPFVFIQRATVSNVLHLSGFFGFGLNFRDQFRSQNPKAKRALQITQCASLQRCSFVIRCVLCDSSSSSRVLDLLFLFTFYDFRQFCCCGCWVYCSPLSNMRVI